jgi:hypothetical protein
MEKDSRDDKNITGTLEDSKEVNKLSDLVVERQVQHLQSLRATRNALLQNYQKAKDDILHQINEIDSQLAKNRVSFHEVISKDQLDSLFKDF